MLQTGHIPVTVRQADPVGLYGDVEAFLRSWLAGEQAQHYDAILALHAARLATYGEAERTERGTAWDDLEGY